MAMGAATSFKHTLISGTALVALAALLPCAASAQVSTDQSTPEASTPTGAATPAPARGDESGEVIVTGSRIKQDPNNSALPLQIITTQEIERNGISSPEQ